MYRLVEKNKGYCITLFKVTFLFLLKIYIRSEQNFKKSQFETMKSHIWHIIIAK